MVAARRCRTSSVMGHAPWRPRLSADSAHSNNAAEQPSRAHWNPGKRGYVRPGAAVSDGMAGRLRMSRPWGPPRASVARGSGGLGAELTELAGAQIAGNEAALRLGLGQEVYVDLVGAQLRTALADARQVER